MIGESERMLKLASDQLQLAFENIPAAIYLFGKNGEVFFTNLYGAQLLNYNSVEEVLAEKDRSEFSRRTAAQFDILDEHRQPFILSNIPTSIAFRTGKPAERIFLFIHKRDLKESWYLTKATPFPAADGSIEMVLTTSTDITLSKVAEETIRQSNIILEQKVLERTKRLSERNHFVETLLDSFVDSIMVFDQDLICVATNKIAARQLAQKFSDGVLGKSWSSLYPDAPSGLEEKALIALNTKRITHHQLKIGSDDTYVNVEFIPLENENNNRIMEIRRDITTSIKAAQSIQKANEQLEDRKNFVEKIIETSKEYIAVYASDMTLLSVNRAVEELLGVQREEIVGKKFLDLYPAAQNTSVERDLQDAMRGKIIQNEPHLSSLTGRYVENYITPLFNNEGEIYGALAIAHDVTDITIKQKEIATANAEMQLKNLELEKANAELASFSYIASHDLKEPLRKIQTFSKRILEVESFSGTTQDYFNRIIAASERMENLIEALFDFSLANTTDLVFERTDLNAIVSESREYLKETILEKEAQIIVDPLPFAHVVPIQFSQLITNLLDNALKYSRSSIPPVVHISCHLLAGNEITHPIANHNKNYYLICMKDNGIGFDNRYATKIFELFQRLHNKNEYSGTGIGLAICKKIVSNHNGFITTESTPGEGSLFKIYIPVR